MRRISFFELVGASFFAATLLASPGANAMPFQQQWVTSILPVASACGLGVRRGPFDRCDPFYYAGYGSGPWNAYYIGPVRGGVCGGRGTHIACNAYGICWVACN